MMAMKELASFCGDLYLPGNVSEVVSANSTPPGCSHRDAKSEGEGEEVTPVKSDSSTSSSSGTGGGGGAWIMVPSTSAGISRATLPVSVGEGSSSRQYDLLLPGMEDCIYEEEEEWRGLPCSMNPFREEDDDRNYELQYLRDDLSFHRIVLHHLELLIAMGARTLEEVESMKVKEKLKGQVASISADPKEQAEMDAHISKTLKSRLVPNGVTEAQRQRLHEVAKQTILENLETAADRLPDNLDRLNINPSLELSEILEELRKKAIAKLEDYNSSLLYLEEKFPCCSLFGEYPLTRSPTELMVNWLVPFSRNLLNVLATYRTSPALRERWSEELKLNPFFEFPRMLQFRLHQLIHAYPNGIDSTLFWVKFLDVFGYTPENEQFLLKDLHEIVELNPHIFHIASEATKKCKELPLILFPACKADHVTPISILKESYHRIKALLGLHFFLPVDGDLVNSAVDEFRANWDMNIETFLQCSIDVMKDQEEIISLHLVTASDEDFPYLKSHLYICINAAPLLDAINKIHNVKKEPKRSAPDPGLNRQSDLFPEGIETEETNCISNEIKPKDEISCQVVTNYGPANFGIVLMNDNYRDRINEFWKQFKIWMENNPMKFEKSRDYEPGQYVLVKGPIITREEEWCRGRVISKSDSYQYKIYFMDHGRVKVVHSSNLSPMPKAVLTLAPAFAIPCSLKTQMSASIAGPVMQDILNGKELKATFHTPVFKNILMTNGWIVSLRYRELCGVGRWKSVRDEIKRRVIRNCGKGACDDDEDSENGMDALVYYLEDC